MVECLDFQRYSGPINQCPFNTKEDVGCQSSRGNVSRIHAATYMVPLMGFRAITNKCDTIIYNGVVQPPFLLHET